MKLFIHIPKNGGSSIVRAEETSKKCFQPNRDMLSTTYRMQTGISRAWGHCRWMDLDQRIRSDFQAFTIVRNPWSWVVSQYMYRRRLLEGGDTGINGFTLDNNFTDFIEMLDKRRSMPYYRHLNWHKTSANFSLQRDYIVDVMGKQRVDVLRFENYDEDTMKYLSLSNPLKPRNVTNVKKKDYRDYYDDSTRKWVENNYAIDIEYFGFTFDGGATKNIWNTGD